MAASVDSLVLRRRLAAGLFLALWLASLALPAVKVFGTQVPGWKILLGGMSENLTLARMWLANPVGLIAAGWAATGRRPPWWLPVLAVALALGSIVQLWPLREVEAGYWLWLASFLPLAVLAAWERWWVRPLRS